MPPLDETSTSQKPENPEQPPPEYTRRLRHPGSGWTLLFYDLAWTATFATLAQNGQFTEPMDYVSYFAFFAAVLWLWASQTLYSIHFYTNDWFHLTSIFLQLFIFGMLAATTNGYDLTTYISHSPGAPDLSSDASDLSDKEQMERFAAERTDLLSAQAMAVAFAITRFLHLIQYLRACFYARWGKGALAREYVPWGRYIRDLVHPQIYAIVVGLIFSNAIFFAVVGIVFSPLGITKLGASLKLGLWVGGFVLEILSHLWYPLLQLIEQRREQKAESEGRTTGRTYWTKDVNPLPLAKVDLSERLDTITTIILGEGINGFAGTLTSILTAPGVGRTIGINIPCTAFIIWFIAYIYFEGPTSGSNPEGEGLRRMIWMVIYLPFLASIFLLFVGIKNQFLLTSVLSMAETTMDEFLNLLTREGFFQSYQNPSWKLNTAIKKFLFARGILWSEEYDKLIEAYNNSTNKAEWAQNSAAWVMRLSLTMVVNAYETFNEQEGIPEEVQSLIDDYNTNSSIPYQDNLNRDRRSMMFYKILTDLLHGSIEGARYILIFAATILICLGVQSIVHSPPRDRYQWGVITSRLVMGTVLALLLFLNLGKYQEFFVPPELENQRAGVYLWLDAIWVLPTIAIAYGVQFLVEIALAFFAKRATVRAKRATVRAKRAPDFVQDEPVLPRSSSPVAEQPDEKSGKASTQS